MHGEGGIVRLHDSIRHLGRRHDAEGHHHAIGILLPDLGDEQAFRFFSNNIQHGVNEFCSFGVVSFGPVIPGTCLAKNKIVRPEDLAVWARANTVHCPRLQIHEHSSRSLCNKTSWL